MYFRDLHRQYLNNKTNIDKAIQTVLDNTDFISGEMVSQLEEELAEYVGVRHCITCANGTDALQLALMVWNVGAGDAVFVPDFTFFSTAEVVALMGATPIFVDVDKKTYNMCPLSLEHAITRVRTQGKLNPKVVIPVDLFGQPADYARIREIAKREHLYVLEDGAQGFGGSIKTERACSFGDISTTSFFPAKPFGCYGDGGAVFTNNDEWASLLMSYRVHGKGSDKYDNVRIGLNSRLDTLQAAILHEKLPVFEELEIKRCNEIAYLYNNNLCDAIITPEVMPGMESSWAQYTIQLSDLGQREHLLQMLKEKDIPSMVYYKKPLHRQIAFSNLDNTEEDFKNTNILCDTVLSLPMHPYMEKQEVLKICEQCNNIISCK